MATRAPCGDEGAARARGARRRERRCSHGGESEGGGDGEGQGGRRACVRAADRRRAHARAREQLTGTVPAEARGRAWRKVVRDLHVGGRDVKTTTTVAAPVATQWRRSSDGSAGGASGESEGGESEGSPFAVAEKRLEGERRL